MSRQAPVRDLPPVVQRLRVRHARRGPLRFSSHRDFQRALERALRRAEVPIAFSHGFNPRPRVSYAGAAATGVASEAEYLELGVTQELDPDRVREALDAALPAGLDVLEVVVARTPDLVARLEASVFELRLPGVDAVRAVGAVDDVLARPAVEVERLTKNGVRRFDVRAPLVVLAARDGAAGEPAGGGPCAILDLVVRHVTPAVRPDDVLAALRHTSDLDAPVPVLVTRWAQGPLVPDPGAGAPRDAVSDPLAPDRDGAVAAAHGTT